MNTTSRLKQKYNKVTIRERLLGAALQCQRKPQEAFAAWLPLDPKHDTDYDIEITNMKSESFVLADPPETGSPDQDSRPAVSREGRRSDAVGGGSSETLAEETLAS